MTPDRWEELRWKQRDPTDKREGAPRDEHDLLLDAALEAARLLARAMNTHAFEPDFVQEVRATIRRIYLMDADRAHDA